MFFWGNFFFHFLRSYVSISVPRTITRTEHCRRRGGSSLMVFRDDPRRKHRDRNAAFTSTLRRESAAVPRIFCLSPFFEHPEQTKKKNNNNINTRPTIPYVRTRRWLMIFNRPHGRHIIVARKITRVRVHISGININRSQTNKQTNHKRRTVTFTTLMAHPVL